MSPDPDTREDPSFMDLEQLQRCEAWMRHIARGLLGDADDVDDVLQDTWLATLRGTGGTIRHPLGHLRAVTRHVSLNALRRRLRRQRHEGHGVGPSDEDDPAAIAERLCLQRKLMKCILDLDEPYRSTILWRYARGLEPIEIARRAGVPASTVRVRIKRALELIRKRLRDDLGDRGGEHLLLVLLGLRRRPAGRVRPAVFASAAAGLLGLGIWLGAAEPSARPRLSDVAPVNEPGRPGPRRVHESQHEAPATAARRSVAAARPVLSGRLTVMSTDRSIEGRLTIEAAPWAVGRLRHLPTRLMPRKPPTDAPLVPVAAAEVGNGELFELPVPEAGYYRVLVRSSRARGGFFVWPSTERALELRITLLDSIEITMEASRPAPVRAGLWSDGGYRLEKLSPLAGGRFVIRGPIFPGVRVGVSHGAGGRDWWCEVFDRRVALEPPLLGPSRGFAVLDEDTLEPIEDATLELLWLGRDVRPWIARFAVDAAGEAAWQRPRERAPLEGRLDVVAPGYRGQRISLRRGRDVDDDVLLRRKRALDLRLRGEGGGVIDDAAVVVCREARPVWWGLTGPSGRVVEQGARVERRSATSRAEVCFVFREDGSVSRRAFSSGEGGVIVVPEPRPLGVRLTSPRGEPLAGAGVEVFPMAEAPVLDLGPAAAGRTAEDGIARVGRLGGAPWLVVARCRGHVTVTADWRDPGGGRLDLVLPLDPDGRHAEESVRLRVTDGEGRPLGHVLCFLSVDGRAWPRRSTDIEGRAVFDGLPRGQEVGLTVLASHRRPSLAVPRSIRPGEEEISVPMLGLVTVATSRFDTADARDPSASRGFLLCDLEQGCGRVTALELEPGVDRGPLTDERQRVTLYQPGYRPASRIFAPPRPGSRVDELAFSLERGPRITLSVGGGAERVEVEALEIAAPARHGGRLRLLRAHFGCELAVDGGRVRLPALTPGRYRIRVLFADGSSLQREVDADADRMLVLED